MSISTATLTELFQAHQKFLWGLSYRLTGNAADADDIVQETFIRALHSPPPRTDQPWRPWLVRVALNLGRDLLRQRRRRGYEGPWLPSPIAADFEEALPSYDPASAAHENPTTRYDLLESVSFAFLLALEALTPTQRAVLLLREVFDYSVRETADALGISEPNVKTTLHRARKAMQEYDRSRQPLTKTLQQQTRQALERFLSCLRDHDVAGAASLLAADVRQLGDGGGEFIAARVPVVGREKVLLFNTRLNQMKPGDIRFEWRVLNGIPSLVVDLLQPPTGIAPRLVMTCALNAAGQISRIYNVLATRKLTAVGK